jgi:NADH:ubiquinone oxidoreductase subunit H
MLGSIRCISQMVAYEIAITVIIMPIILLSSSLNYGNIYFLQFNTTWFIYTLLPFSILFFICCLAETNRVPFDLIEAEAELVAGYNVEYSGFLFAFLFIGEYASIMLMSCLFVILFLNGGDYIINFLTSNKILFKSTSCISNLIFYNFILSIKTMSVCFFFVLIRAILPRYRFDQLLTIG